MAVIGEILFWSGGDPNLSDVLRHNLTNAVPEKIGELSSSEFEKKSDEELVAELTKRYEAEPLVLHLDKADADVTATSVEVHNHFGGMATVQGLRVAKLVPFSGERQFFNMTPSSYDMNPPHGIVRNQTLVIGMEVRESEDETAMTHIEQTLAKVQQNIDRQRPQIEEYNGQLPGVISAAVKRRRESLGKAASLADRLRGRP